MASSKAFSRRTRRRLRRVALFSVWIRPLATVQRMFATSHGSQSPNSPRSTPWETMPATISMHSSQSVETSPRTPGGSSPMTAWFSMAQKIWK